MTYHKGGIDMINGGENRRYDRGRGVGISYSPPNEEGRDNISVKEREYDMEKI